MKIYDPMATEGAPCAMQMFANTLEDEECLEVARIINRALQY